MINKNHIEMIEKSPPEFEGVIVTTKDTTQKKRRPHVRKEAVYPSQELANLMQTPPTKKFKAISKFASITKNTSTKGDLRSSLPVGLRDASYFDNQDQ